MAFAAIARHHGDAKIDRPYFTACGVICGGNMAYKIKQFLPSITTGQGIFICGATSASLYAGALWFPICWRVDAL